MVVMTASASGVPHTLGRSPGEALMAASATSMAGSLIRLAGLLRMVEAASWGAGNGATGTLPGSSDRQADASGAETICSAAEVAPIVSVSRAPARTSTQFSADG